MEHEICTKIPRNFELKLRAITRGYSTVKIARPGDVLLEVFERETSSIEGQSMHQKIEVKPGLGPEGGGLGPLFLNFLDPPLETL